MTNEEEPEKKGKPKKIDKFFISLIKLFIKMYPNIHQLQEVYVDKSSGDVYVKDSTSICKTYLPFKDKFIRECSILAFFVNFWDKIFSKFKLDEDVRIRIYEILEKRKEEMEKKKKKFCEKCGEKILKHHCKNDHKINDGNAKKIID